MGKIAENWDRVMQSIPCPVCGAVRGAPCSNPYGMIFDGRGHQQRRDKFHRKEGRLQESLEVSPCDASEVNSATK